MAKTGRGFKVILDDATSEHPNFPIISDPYDEELELEHERSKIPHECPHNWATRSDGSRHCLYHCGVADIPAS